MSAGSVALRGDMGSVAAAARNVARLDTLNETMSWLRRGIESIQAAGNSLALTAMLHACRPLEQQAQQFASVRLAAGQSLQHYANQVSTMQQEARMLLARKANEQSARAQAMRRLASLDDDTGVISAQSRRLNTQLDEANATLRLIEQQLTELDQARVRTNRACAAEINACTARLNSMGEGSDSSGGITTVGFQTSGARPIDLLRATFMSPEQVLEWWNSLSDAQRATLKRESSLIVGNLDGVPFEDRIAAHVETAKRYLKDSDLSPEEKRYWKQVRDGKVKLVVLDRENGRIVEMLGELGPETKQVITYVPGTATFLRDFYSGKAKRVPEYLKQRFQQAVIFVYKDFPGIGWINNLDEDGLAARGENLARFGQGAIGTDPRLAGLPKKAVGYSAGMAVVGGAERFGAAYDQVISLGGSYVPDEWTPKPETQYVDIRYKGDILNKIDDKLDLKGLNTINGMPEVFSQVRPESPDAGENSMSQHGRLGAGPGSNQPALDALVEYLRQES